MFEVHLSKDSFKQQCVFLPRKRFALEEVCTVRIILHLRSLSVALLNEGAIQFDVNLCLLAADSFLLILDSKLKV